MIKSLDDVIISKTPYIFMFLLSAISFKQKTRHIDNMRSTSLADFIRFNTLEKYNILCTKITSERSM